MTTRVATARPENGGGVAVGDGDAEGEGDGDGGSLGSGESEGEASGDDDGTVIEGIGEGEGAGDTTIAAGEPEEGDGVARSAQPPTMTARTVRSAARRRVRRGWCMAPEW
jgi:hypothetical protein